VHAAEASLGTSELRDLIAASIQHIHNTTGRGQSEVWSLFRSAFEMEQAIPDDLIRMADMCRDPSMYPASFWRRS
jgi:midasin